MFDNDESLHAAILQDLIGITQEVTDETVETVKDIINETVYQLYEPRVYERLGENGGFIGSWMNSTELKGDTIESTVFSNPSLMVFDHPHHQSPDGVDRYNMDEIIAEGTDWDYSYYYNPGGAYTEYWKFPRDYWTPIEELFTPSYISGMFENSFSERMINFIKS
jgi:hypothetical protein